MNGTGIIEHDVYLPGAAVGRPYFFVVQGTTADGTLYRSEIGTFTIPASGTAPSASAASPGPNVALDATIDDVSSEFNDSFAAANAIDDQTATEWSSAGDGDGAFITLDLGSDQATAGVEFVSRSMLDGTAITETYTVTIDDGEPLGPFPAATPASPAIGEVDAHGRVVRFDVDTSTGGNVGAVEVRVYGADGADGADG